MVIINNQKNHQQDKQGISPPELCFIITVLSVLHPVDSWLLVSTFESN